MIVDAWFDWMQLNFVFIESAWGVFEKSEMNGFGSGGFLTLKFIFYLPWFAIFGLAWRILEEDEMNNFGQDWSTTQLCDFFFHSSFWDFKGGLLNLKNQNVWIEFRISILISWSGNFIFGCFFLFIRIQTLTLTFTTISTIS